MFVLFFLLALFIVVTGAAIYLERIGWEEAAIWAVVFVVMAMILRPKTVTSQMDWIPLMIGMGVVDIILLFRTGLENTSGGRWKIRL